MTEKEFDILIKQKLDAFEADVPDACWDAISQSLPTDNRQRIMPLMWQRVAVAAVLVLGVSLASYLFITDKNSAVPYTNVVTIKHTKQIEPAKTLATNERKATSIAHKKSPIAHVALTTATQKPVFERFNAEEISQPSLNSIAQTIPQPSIAADTIQKPLSESVQIENVAATKPQQKTTEQQIEEFIRLAESLKDEEPIDIPKNGKSSSLALLAGLPTNASSTPSGEFRTLRSTSNTGEVVNLLNASQSSASSGLSTRRHSLPLSIGFLLNTEISRNIMIETGLHYTYLRSDQEQTGLPYYSNEIQKLHYLGIPVSLTYQFAHTRRFSFYAKAGGMLEKNIAGTWLEEVKNNNQTIYSALQHDLEDKLQWSVHTGVGINYRLLGWLNLYVEPSYTYFPDNGSNIDNIRKKEKYELSLQGGLKAIFQTR